MSDTTQPSHPQHDDTQPPWGSLFPSVKWVYPGCTVHRGKGLKHSGSMTQPRLLNIAAGNNGSGSNNPGRRGPAQIQTQFDERSFNQPYPGSKTLRQPNHRREGYSQPAGLLLCLSHPALSLWSPLCLPTEPGEQRTADGNKSWWK